MSLVLKLTGVACEEGGCNVSDTRLATASEKLLSADARTPANHQPIAIVLDLMNPQRTEQWPHIFDGRHGSMKPDGRLTIIGGGG
jgi:hypothetical protein